MGLETLGELEPKLLCIPVTGAVYGLLAKFWLKTIFSSNSPAWLSSSIASISSFIGCYPFAFYLEAEGVKF